MPKPDLCGRWWCTPPALKWTVNPHRKRRQSRPTNQFNPTEWTCYNAAHVCSFAHPRHGEGKGDAKLKATKGGTVWMKQYINHYQYIDKYSYIFSIFRIIWNIIQTIYFIYIVCLFLPTFHFCNSANKWCKTTQCKTYRRRGNISAAWVNAWWTLSHFSLLTPWQLNTSLSNKSYCHTILYYTHIKTQYTTSIRFHDLLCKVLAEATWTYLNLISPRAKIRQTRRQPRWPADRSGSGPVMYNHLKTTSTW